VSALPRVLLVDGNRGALRALEKALADAGFTNVTGVTSGAFALTMLERDRPDLIVSRAHARDIDGWELCGIVRSDPAMAGVLFLLIVPPGDDMPAGALEGGPDRTLVGEFPPASVVAEVAGLLASTKSPVSPPERAPAGLRGTLAIMDLPDLAQAIALGHQTGDLKLALDAGEGRIVFDRGRVVHAEFAALTGEAAFAALVATAHREGHASFAFEPREQLEPGLAQSIDRGLRQLLLSVAVEIDEGRASTVVAGASAATSGQAAREPVEPKARSRRG